MPETTPTDFPEDVARGDQGALSADQVERIVDEFRGWLREAAMDAPELEASPGWDWHEFARLFVALRHEVHLQTRVVRNQQEQAAALLTTMQQALAALQQEHEEKASKPAGDDRPAPWLKVMLEALDGLDAAHREMARLAQSLAAAEAEGGASAARGWWSRLFGGAERQRPSDDRLAALVESLNAGYAMSRQKLERFLIEHGLEPMSCEGQPFDAESMEVFEVASAEGCPSGTVVAEIRRGYRWRDRTYRCALVRVAG